MAEPSAGQPRVPGFTIQRRVSTAADAVDVWEGRALGGATVAIKTLSQRDASAEHTHRFWNEAAVLDIVGGSRHVVELVARVESPPALVLAWAMGGSLREQIHPLGYDRDPHQLAAGTVARLGVELCDALEWLHFNDVYHRDVKPANVLLDASGSVVLADFGIAAHGNPPRSLPDGWVDAEIGTLGYAAPELLKHPDSATEAIDLYGLGATLYEALTGRLPFDMGRTETDDAFRGRVASGEAPVPIRHRGVEAPPPLVRIVEALLGIEPDRRGGTAASVGRMLRPLAV